MTFPVYIHVLGRSLHPHPVMEVIAYTGGFQLYRLTRGRFPRAAAGSEQTLWVFVGAVFGALIGSKLLPGWSRGRTTGRTATSWPGFDTYNLFYRDGKERELERVREPLVPLRVAGEELTMHG